MSICVYTTDWFKLNFQWNSGNLLTLGWSDAEELLCVQDDGLVLIYNMFGQYQHTFSMGQEAKDTKVIDAKIFASNSGTGVAVMTTNYRIFLINSITEPKNRQLPEMPSKASRFQFNTHRHTHTHMILKFDIFIWIICRINTRSNMLGNNKWRSEYMLFSSTWTWTFQIKSRIQCIFRTKCVHWKWIQKYYCDVSFV